MLLQGEYFRAVFESATEHDDVSAEAGIARAIFVLHTSETETLHSVPSLE